jgi:hypothetical protein
MTRSSSSSCSWLPSAMARIRTVSADKGYGAEKYRDLRHRFSAKPRIHKCGQTHGWGFRQMTLASRAQ